MSGGTAYSYFVCFEVYPTIHARTLQLQRKKLSFSKKRKDKKGFRADFGLLRENHRALNVRVTTLFSFAIFSNYR